MTTTLVFDWNGTLLDDAEALLGTTNAILGRFNRPHIGMVEFRELCSFPFVTFYKSLGLNDNEIEDLNQNGSAVFHDNYEPLASKSPLRKGARELLEEARKQNIRTLILSNHVIDAIHMQLQRLGVDNLITEVLAYANRETQYKDMTKGERLRLYMQANNLNPAKIIIVGDMPEEREIAHALGLTSVAITGGFVSEPRLRAVNPHYLIQNFYELLPILKERKLL